MSQNLWSAQESVLVERRVDALNNFFVEHDYVKSIFLGLEIYALIFFIFLFIAPVTCYIL